MEQIKIDLVPNGVMSVAHASQFDVGRSMKFLLTDEGVTYILAGTEVITLKLRKPDGTDDTISLVNTSSSYVEWTTVDGDLDLSGVYLAEITITSGDDVLGTANFLLKVEADPYDGKNVRTVTVGPADICTFETTLPEPYQSVLVNVLATGGNGTPDNPIPINGYTEANITANGNTYTIAFGQTVYGGVLDVTRGKLTVTHNIVDLGDLNWVNETDTQTGLCRASVQFTDCVWQSVMVCSAYNYNPTTSYNGLSNGDIALTNSVSIPLLRIRNTDYSTYTNAQIKEAVTGMKLVYQTKTPFDIDLTPQVISAVVGTNNVFADCGETEVKYLKAGA